MNKTELVSLVAQKAQISKESAAEAVDATFNGIASALQSGDTVRIVGFGNFQVAHRKASNGRNPRTGEPIQIPASQIPKFKAGKALKEAVNS
ncbi:MAG TPA: HU family DNA-binding protein [Rhizobiales bacterium]|nr:DNA-binding protein HU 1 [bacterium BMS3Bbin10]HDO52025.1 HU family DNA-binding protein [Hyphomicrobiales bacterium]